MTNLEKVYNPEISRRGFMGLTAGAALTLFLSGCSGSSEQGSTETTSGDTKGGIFSLPINTNSIASLTPYSVKGSDDLLIASAPCYDPLFIISTSGTRWYLAESLEPTSDDGCHYELKLKDGVTWHDGEKFTADDVVYTVGVFQDSTNGTSSNKSVIYDGNPLTCEKKDDLTCEITLVSPFSAFETEFGRIQPLPKHIFDGNTSIKDDTENLQKCIGTGPYKLDTYSEGDSITYVRYDDYYRGTPSLDSVVIKLMPDESAQEAALQSGELSMMRVTSQTKLDKYKGDDEYVVYTIPEARLNYLAFNYQTEIMKNDDARKAICLALNADEIITGAYGSTELAEVAKNICSPQTLYYNDEMTGYQQNIEEAKKLAESSGLTNVTLNYIYFTARPNMKETAQIVQQQLEAIGVKVDIQGQDAASFFRHLFAAWLTGEFVEDTSWDLGSNGMDSLDGDPATKEQGWRGELVEKGSYVSSATNELWDKAVAAIDVDEREKLYKELQQSISDDYALYPMANTNYVIVCHKEFTGIDAVKRVPIFEDWTKITKA